MAIQAGTPWHIAMVAVDGEGHTSNIGAWYEGSEDIADVQTAIEALVPLISAITTCSIINVYANRLINTFNTGTPQGDVEKGAMFNFRAVGTPKRMLMRIPGIEPALIPDDTKDVDLAAASVVAFVNAMKNGVGGLEPRDSEGREIDEIMAAQEHYTRARK